MTEGGHEVDVASGLYLFSCEAKEWTGVRLDSVFQYKMSVELPWLMSTLDIMKFVMMMEITMGSSWLMGLIPMKSLSLKVIGGRLCGDGVLT